MKTIKFSAAKFWKISAPCVIPKFLQNSAQDFLENSIHTISTPKNFLENFHKIKYSAAYCNAVFSENYIY